VKLSILLFAFTFLFVTGGPAHAKPFEVDRIPTSSGDLAITFVGHGTLMLEYGGRVIHVDPFGKLTDYKKMPDADLILITHEHGDHLDLAAIAAIRKNSTVIVANPAAASKIDGALAMENGQRRTVGGLPIEAVAAYNVVHKRDNGEPFHPPGRDNGYVIGFGDKHLTAAGREPVRIEHKGCGGAVNDRRICESCGAELSVRDARAISREPVGVARAGHGRLRAARPFRIQPSPPTSSPASSDAG